MTMTLKIYANGEQVNTITTTDRAEIYEHVARIYRQKLDKLADRVEIVTGWSELQRATIYTRFNRWDAKSTKYKYVYHFDGVTL